MFCCECVFPEIRPFFSFFSTLPLIAGYWDFHCKWRYHFQVYLVSANTNISFFDVGVSSSPSNKTFHYSLVHFLLLLAIETLSLNDNMIYSWVMLVRILSSIALMWVCLPHPAIRPFVHSLVYFLLLLTIETFTVNDDMSIKCVRLLRILTLVILMWVCLPHPAIRPLFLL